MSTDYFLNGRKADLWTSVRNIFAAELRNFRRPIRIVVSDSAGTIFKMKQKTLESAFELLPESAHLNQDNLRLPLSIVFADHDGQELSVRLKLG